MTSRGSAGRKPSRQKKRPEGHTNTLPPRPEPGGSSRNKSRKPASDSPQQTTIRKVLVIREALRKSAWWGTVSQLVQSERSSCDVHALECLGIGSFVNCSNARHQLACAMLLKELLNNPAVCSLADPVMEDDDEQIAVQCGFQVVAAHHYELKAPPSRMCSVLFMPHCDFALNESTLIAAKTFNFKAVIFLANEFSKYVTSVSTVARRRSESLIGKLYAGGMLKEKPCPHPKLSTSETAFNDLAVTTVTS